MPATPASFTPLRAAAYDEELVAALASKPRAAPALVERPGQAPQLVLRGDEEQTVATVGDVRDAHEHARAEVFYPELDAQIAGESRSAWATLARRSPVAGGELDDAMTPPAWTLGTPLEDVAIYTALAALAPDLRARAIVAASDDTIPAATIAQAAGTTANRIRQVLRAAQAADRGPAESDAGDQPSPPGL